MSEAELPILLVDVDADYYCTEEAVLAGTASEATTELIGVTPDAPPTSEIAETDAADVVSLAALGALCSFSLLELF